MRRRWTALICAAALCLGLGAAPASGAGGGMTAVRTGIAADAVVNEEGYGCLRRSGEGTLLEGTLTKMPQAALIGRDGYALVCKKTHTLWVVPGAAGRGGMERVFQFVDSSGRVTHTLPEGFPEVTSAGVPGVGTRYSCGWFGEGLAACVEGKEDAYGYRPERKGYMGPKGVMEISLAGRGYQDGYPFSEGLT